MRSARFLTMTAAGCVLAATVTLPASASAAPRAHVHRIELGTLGGAASVATEINNWGTVVGAATTRSGAQHAFVWQHGRMIDLRVGGTGSRASDINDHGQIVGTRTLANGDVRGFLWQHGRTTDLGSVSSASVFVNEYGQVAGTGVVANEAQAFFWARGHRTYIGSLPFWCCSQARGINDRGQVIASALNTESFEGAVLWQRGTLTDLGTLSAGLPQAIPLGINNRGQVTGYSFVGDGSHAFRWQHGVMSDLGTLGGAQSVAVDINAGGRVTGTSGTATEGIDHAFLTRPGGLIDLGALDAQNSTANALNDYGEVVGVLQRPTGDENFSSSAFAWRQGLMIDLGHGLPYNTQATGVNNRGQVIGAATRNGSDRAVLWLISF